LASLLFLLRHHQLFLNHLRLSDFVPSNQEQQPVQPAQQEPQLTRHRRRPARF
jgi:hypothetical protein